MFDFVSLYKPRTSHDGDSRSRPIGARYGLGLRALYVTQKSCQGSGFLVPWEEPWRRRRWLHLY